MLRLRLIALFVLCLLVGCASSPPAPLSNRCTQPDPVARQVWWQDRCAERGLVPVCTSFRFFARGAIVCGCCKPGESAEHCYLER